jgi:mRNA interferase YafQ
MRTIEWSTAFKRDMKRESRGQRGKVLDALLEPIGALLAADKPLPVAHRDHALTGAWRGCRECHAKPDLVLIYWRPDDSTLEFVRLASYAELFD